jgi:hypothetical protein
VHDDVADDARTRNYPMVMPALRNLEMDSRAQHFTALVRLVLKSGSVSNARFEAETGPYSPRLREILSKAELGSIGGVGSPDGMGF